MNNMKHKSGYIICGDEGPMFWEEDQLVYADANAKKHRVGIFPTWQSAHGAIKRSSRWRESVGFDAGQYWIYRLDL